MRRLRRNWTLIGLSCCLMLLLAACEDAYTIRLINGGQHVIGPGETLDAELLISEGNVRLEPGSRLEGSVYMLRGSLDLQGEVQGDVSVIGGRLLVGQQAMIGGGLLTGGGTVEWAPGASIDRIVSTPIQLPSTEEMLSRTNQNRLIWWLPQSLIAAGLAYFLVTFFPRPPQRVVKALTEHPLVAAALGVLVGIVGPALLVMMAFTVVLIPLVILFLLVMIPALLYAWTVFGMIVGRWLARRLGKDWRPPVQAFWGTLVFLLFVIGLEFIPVAGPLLSLLLVITGLGAVLLTRFGMQTFVPAIETDLAD